MTFDKTLLDALEQLARGESIPATSARRLARESLCTDGLSPTVTVFGEDVLRLRCALADPTALTPPAPVEQPEHCLEVTDGEVALLRLAALVPLTHAVAERLARPVEPRRESGSVVLDLTDQELAAVDYVFQLCGVTSSVKFHNRLRRRINWRDTLEEAGRDPAEVRGYRRLQ